MGAELEGGFARTHRLEDEMSNTQQIKQFLSAFLCSVFVLANVAHAIEFQFINVGDPDTEIPGGTGTFDSFSLPGISDGWLVYRGFAEDRNGIYRRRISDPASLELIADCSPSSKVGHSGALG